MKTLLLAAGFLIVATPAARPLEVDFHVTTTIPEEAEGPSHERTVFEVGRRRIAIKPPNRGRLSAVPGGMTIFLESKGLSGEIHITNSAFTPAADFTAHAPEYQEAAEGSLPKEAEKPELLGSINDLVAVNAWKSLGFEWKYTFAARPTHRQVAWVNLDAEHQICVTMASDEDYWKETTAVAKRFLNSWYWMPDTAK